MVKLLMQAFAALGFLFVSAIAVQAVYDTPDNLPDQVAPGVQTGSNQCRRRWGEWNPKANCQNLYVNNAYDFCLYGPKSSANVGDAEADVVSYCSRKGYGTRLIPPGTITGLQFLKTPSYVQLALVGDFTKIGVAPKDEGGELDHAGPDSKGNPKGALAFTSSYTDGRTFQRSRYWHQFIGYNEASVRLCNPKSSKGYLYCPHIYDRMGSQWVDVSNRYEAGIFEQCDGKEALPPGWYNGKQWKQGEKPEPEAHPPGPTFNCKKFNTVPSLGTFAPFKPGS